MYIDIDVYILVHVLMTSFRSEGVDVVADDAPVELLQEQRTYYFS